MNPQERDQLTWFLEQLSHARIDNKDPEAEALIRESAAKQPDALYLLVQKCAQLQQALQTSQQQAEQLREQLRREGNNGKSNGGFFGSNQWGSQAAPPAAPTPTAPVSNSGTGHSWLGNIASTAAGVAAGAFLFEGVQHLFGHHGSNSLLGDSMGREETVINNFFEAPGGQPDNSSHSGDFAGLSDGLGDSTDFDSSNDDPWV